MSIWQNTQYYGGDFVQLIHERIKKARIAKGLSQKRIAEILGISQPGYQQMESGKYPDMRISTLCKLCDILEVSADWILGRDQ